MRSTDLPAAAGVIEKLVQPYLDAPETRMAALVAAGQAWLAAHDTVKALALAQGAHAVDPSAEAPAGLALEMLPNSAGAESIIQSHLQAKPASNTVRLLYTRALTDSARFADAAAQLQILTAREPALAPPWLTLGALQLEMKRPADAAVSLQKYVALVQAAPASAGPDSAADNDDDDEAHPATKTRA